MGYGTENGRISRLACYTYADMLSRGVCQRVKLHTYMPLNIDMHVQAIKTEIRQVVAQKRICIVLWEHFRTSISNTCI